MPHDVPVASPQQVNLLSCENVSKAFGERPLLRDVSLGVSKGERIGVVGRNGAGKSTLLRVLAGAEPPNSGRVTRGASVVVGALDQVGISAERATIRSHVLGDRDEHVGDGSEEWHGLGLPPTAPAQVVPPR